MSALSVIAACVMSAAGSYELPPAIIWSLLSIEGGKVGTISSNSNGSKDLGPMQINTIHIPEIAKGSDASVTTVARSLIEDPCYNIAIGAWHLRQKIEEVDGDFWQGVGRYHSKTPHVQSRYMDTLLDRIERLYGEPALLGEALPDIPPNLDLLPVITEVDIPADRPAVASVSSPGNADQVWTGIEGVEVASVFQKPSHDHAGSGIDAVDDASARSADPHSEVKSGSSKPGAPAQSGGILMVDVSTFNPSKKSGQEPEKNTEAQ